jgi:hypothetical protein
MTHLAKVMIAMICTFTTAHAGTGSGTVINITRVP